MFQAFYIIFGREIFNLGNPNTREEPDVVSPTKNFNSIRMLVLSFRDFFMYFMYFL